MNKTDLIAAIAEHADIPKVQAQRALDATLETISNELAKGGNVQLVGFGTFSVKSSSERTGRNPATGEPMTIAAKKTPGFKAGLGLKQAVN